MAKKVHNTLLLRYMFTLLAYNVFFANAVCATESSEMSSKTKVFDQESALSVNEPIYFVYGGSDDLKARFQFSFKYRIFEKGGTVVNHAPWLKNFNFAYTQTSLWDLSNDSAPFEDSSYRPSFFFDIQKSNALSWVPAFIRTGYEHESNGQAGADSRSMDTAYLWAFWGGRFKGRDWFIGPKVWSYLQKADENQDIEEFKGYGELWLQYGNEDSWLLATKFRPGRLSHSALQVELSWPTRRSIFARTGGFLFVQYFDGYGESLLDYNQRSDRQIRLGFAIVR